MLVVCSAMLTLSALFFIWIVLQMITNFDFSFSSSIILLLDIMIGTAAFLGIHAASYRSKRSLLYHIVIAGVALVILFGVICYLLWYRISPAGIYHCAADDDMCEPLRVLWKWAAILCAIPILLLSTSLFSCWQLLESVSKASFTHGLV